MHSLGMPQSGRSDLLPGTLELLVLKTISIEPMHGYAIAQHIKRVSSESLKVEEGSLYPALYRLEDRGWVLSDWGASENNRRARYYRLTPKGRAQLKIETTEFTRFAQAVFQALAGPIRGSAS